MFETRERKQKYRETLQHFRISTISYIRFISNENNTTDKFYFTNSAEEFRKNDDLSCESVITVLLTIIHSFQGDLV